MSAFLFMNIRFPAMIRTGIAADAVFRTALLP